MKTGLIAKITRPAALGIHPRKRLFRLIDRGARRGLTWISGPPGSGKTSLMASYLESCKQPCIWYQLDERDADPGTFFYFMSLSIKKASSGRGEPLPVFTPEYRFGLPAFTKTYFEDFFFRLPNPLTVVFDNHQDIPPDSEFHEITRHLLETIPPGGHVFILSRNEPPPALARPCANDRVSLLGWEDLRFTPQEAEEMIRKKIEGGFDPEILTALYEKTEGWAAGIMLFVVGAKIHGNNRLLTLSANREVCEYFAREIFARVKKETQEFLLKTGVLPRVTAGVAEQLTGMAGARNVLEELSQNHYFTEKYVEEDPVYIYHPLFREFLLARAAASFSPDEIRSIRRRAAEVLQTPEWFEDAAGLFRDAGDWDALTRLLVRQAGSLLEQGRSKTLEKWIQSIPPEIRRHSADLTYWTAMAKQPFHPGESRALFEESFHLFKKEKDDKGMLSAWAEMVDSILVQGSDFAALDPWIDWILKWVREGRSFPSRRIETRVTSALTGALVWRQPWRPQVPKWVERSMSLCREEGHRNLHSLACISMVNYFAWSGNLAQCALVADEIRNAAKISGASPLIVITWKWIEALLYNRTTKSHDLAHRAITEGLEIAGKTGVHLWDHMLYAQGVYAAFNKGDMETARQFLGRLASSLQKDRRQTHFQHQYLSGWYHLLTGDFLQAFRCAEKAVLLAEQTGMYFSQIQSRILIAELLYRKGEPRRAQIFLRRAERLIRRSRSRLLEYLLLMKEAQFALKRGDEASGAVSLREAMQLGRREGYVRLFPWWQPSAMAPLCARALKEGIEVEYVRALISEHNVIPEDPPLEIENWPWPLKIQTLGEFAIIKDGRPVQFSRKVQKKPLEMLKILIANRGKVTKEVEISDWLWPETDGDAAHNTFRSNLSRLRHILSGEAVIFQEGKVWLDPRCCWVDAWVFERLAEGIGALRKAGEKAPAGSEHATEAETTKMVALMEKALSLYRGHFLSYDEEENSWTVSYRERLRSKFIQLVSTSGKYLQQSGKWEAAREVYLKAIETDELAEEFYQELMTCCKRCGDPREGREIFQRCKRALSAQLGLDPSPKTAQIFETLMN